MKSYYFPKVFLVFVFSLILTVHLSAENGTRLLHQPDISDELVVFVYAGDLYTAPIEGGQASVLTTHPGSEFGPKFSPDGKFVAFTGEYDGNADV